MHRIDCLYFLADGDDTETARIAQQNDFREVDVRLTLDRPIYQEDSPPTPALDSRVRLARESDLAVLRRCARTLHRDSRFYYDEHSIATNVACCMPPGSRTASGSSPNRFRSRSGRPASWLHDVRDARPGNADRTARRRSSTRGRVSGRRWCNNSSRGPRSKDLVAERSLPRNATPPLKVSIDIADFFQHPFSVGITAGLQTNNITTYRRDHRCLQP